MNTTTTGFSSVPGIPGGAITILYQFTLRGDNHFSFAWLNSAGPAAEGIGTDPGLVTLAEYNNSATPADKLGLARNIGHSLYDLMDRLPPTEVLLGSIVSLASPVFDPKNDRWEERGKSSRVPDACR